MALLGVSATPGPGAAGEEEPAKGSPKRPAAAELDPRHAEKMTEGLALFKTNVRAVLVRRCLRCHGGEKTRSRFDLATRDGLLRGGRQGIAVTPGDHRKSSLYRLVAHREEPNMPRKEEKLPGRQIAWIARWIDLGAPYDAPLTVTPAKEGIPATEGGVPAGKARLEDERRDWWSFRPLQQVTLPPVEDESWCRTPIDRLILARLEARRLSPGGPASRREQIRRACLDLTGLPPDPERVDAFVADPAPDAYDKLIDELLASPRYGERWARHWLDAARFAESHGFEHDYDRPHAYHYRDFVIEALNRDMPYDQFVSWQIAGDELAPEEPLALMATGFLGAGVFPTQITKKEVERTRYDALDDMASTTGVALLGLTVGCARCHDHKFDPITTREYYRFLSTFTTTVRSEIEIDLDPESTREALVRFEKEHEPLVAARRAFEEGELAGRLARWIDGRPRGQDPGAGWVALDWLESRSRGGATLGKLDDGSLLASGKNPEFDTYTLVAETRLRGITALRLEALAHPSFVKGGPGRASNGNFGLGRLRLTAAPLAGGPAVDVKLVNPRATFQQNPGHLSIAASLDDEKKSGWAVDPQFGTDHAAVFETAEDVGFEAGTRLTFTLEFTVNTQHSIGRLRISVTGASRPVPLEGTATRQAILDILAQLDEGGCDLDVLTEPERQQLLEWYRHRDEQWRELQRAVEGHLRERPQPNRTKVQVTSEGLKPMRHHTQGADFFAKTYVLERGDPDQKLEEAKQGFLRALMRSPDGEKRWLVSPPEGWRTSYRRTALAHWLTDVEYGAGQLLARVVVNRLWQHHLGRGIVSTPNDFGFQGERPTHPELLEWLAAELVRSGWSLKHLHRLILGSQVYILSSRRDDEKMAVDPQNSLLWRRAPRRLEAEAIRDSLLRVSGLLDERMFGPGTLDEAGSRRSVYLTIKRSQLIPMMQLFDAPESLVSLGERPSTTVAPQALMFLNHAAVRRWARAFAERIAPDRGDSLEEAPEEAPGKGIEEAIVRGYRIAVSRRPSRPELDESLAFVRDQIQTYRREGAADAGTLALADFCQVLMSLSEFIYVD